MGTNNEAIVRRVKEIAQADVLQASLYFAKELNFTGIYKRLEHAEEMRKLDEYMSENLIAYVREQAKKMVLFSEVSHQVTGHQANELKIGLGL